MKYPAKQLILALMLTLSCGPQGQAIYHATAADLRAGSIYYAASNCANCHGIDFDGKGSDAARLSAQRFTATNFKALPGPEATPVRYFKAITAGSAKFKEHSYHELTDRARWSMAQFLFSLHPPLAGTARDQQAEATARDIAEARLAYASSPDRRWIIGYNQPAERPRALELAQLSAGLDLVRSTAPAARASVDLTTAESPGALLYGQHCAACHGLRGEGQNIRAGFLACKSAGDRLCGRFISTGTINLGKGVHGGQNGWLPDFASLSDLDLEHLKAYLNQTGQE